ATMWIPGVDPYGSTLTSTADARGSVWGSWCSETAPSLAASSATALAWAGVSSSVIPHSFFPLRRLEKRLWIPVDASPAPSRDALGSLGSHASGATRRQDLAVSAPSVSPHPQSGSVPPAEGEGVRPRAVSRWCGGCPPGFPTRAGLPQRTWPQRHPALGEL